MTRWTMLAIAFAVAACGEGERDRLSRDASDAPAGADSVVRADTGVTETETGAAGGAETGRTVAADTASPPAGAGAGGARGPTGAEAMGGVSAATMTLDLSADQVRRLQAALNDTGCNAGTVDGVVGRRTRQAIACGLEKNNLGRNDLSGLYRSLDLDF